MDLTERFSYLLLILQTARLTASIRILSFGVDLIRRVAQPFLQPPDRLVGLLLVFLHWNTGILRPLFQLSLSVDGRGFGTLK